MRFKPGRVGRPQPVGPAGRLLERPAEDPFVHGGQEPGLLRHGQERVGLEDAQLRIEDPHERLDAHDAAGAQVDDRLVADTQALLVDRASQHPFRAEPPDRRRPQVLIEDLRPVPPPILRPVQRQVGLLQEAVRNVVGVGGGRDPDAHRADEFLRADPERLPAGLGDPLAQRDRLALVGQVLRDDHELVSPETSEGVRWTDELQEALRHRHEDPVADQMAQGIVDDLEPVEVQEQHRQDARSAIEPVERVLQPVHQHVAVGDPGERVGRRPVLQKDVRLLALRDVADGSDDEGLSGGFDPVVRRLDPPVRAVAAPEPVRHGVEAVADEAQIPGSPHRLDVVGMRELLLVATPELVRIPTEQSPGRGRDVAIDALGRGDGDHVGGGSRQRLDVIELVLVSLHEIPGFAPSARCWGRPRRGQVLGLHVVQRAVALRIHQRDRRYDLLPGRTRTRVRAPRRTLLNRTSTRARRTDPRRAGSGAPPVSRWPGSELLGRGRSGLRHPSCCSPPTTNATAAGTCAGARPDSSRPR